MVHDPCYDGRKERGVPVADRIKELKEEVKKGNIRAALMLAEAFKWGYYGGSDPDRAARMYRICCRSRDKRIASLGYFNLGNLYYCGYLSHSDEERERDRARAYDCFMKSALLDKNPAALTRLGDMYRYGQHVEKNEAVSFALYGKAAGD